MSSYTITITADDPGRATTTLTVEVDGTTTRITELVVRAGAGNGLTAGQIPAVDIDLLLRVVTPAAGGQHTITASPAPDADPAAAEKGTAVGAEESLADAGDAAPVTATSSPAEEPAASTPADTEVTQDAVAERTPPTTARASGTSRAGARRAMAASKATTAGRKGTTRTGKGAAATTGERAYRRSPGDLESVYQQTSSVAAVAAHYGVPRHTAQGWVRNLRRRQASPAE